MAGAEVNHSPISNDEVKNEWRAVSLVPIHAFKAWTR